jgi:xanthine dehydrogenase accessory factor
MSSSADTTPADPVLPDGWPDWPHYALTGDIRPPLEALLAGEQPFALATLVEVEGSSPRPLGSQMLIAGDGQVQGYVSGGCVEADLALRARTVLRTDTPELIHYGRGSGNWDIQLTCGGRIGVFVQRIIPGNASLGEIVAAGKARQAIALVIDLETGKLRAGKAGPETCGPSGVFVKIFTPVVRLLIIGGDPVALALAEMARPLGISVHINRPSGPASPPEGLPPGSYYAGPAADFLDAMGLDSWTAVICVSHDLDLDHAVLRQALPGPALYVGALGSRNYREQRLDRLRAEGMPEDALARLKSPVGLDIGARTASEIALSVLAGVVAARDGRA